MSDHVVSGRFNQAEEARAAVNTLSRMGIDGGRIAVDGTEDGLTRAGDERATDAKTGQRLLRSGWIGGLAGAAVFAIWIVIALAAAGAVTSQTVLIAGFVSIVFGGATGLMLALPAMSAMSPAWEDTNQPWTRPHELTVTGVDDDDVIDVREALDTAGADEVKVA